MSFGFAIGDFIAVGDLAWRLYQSCYMVARDAPQEFQALKSELSNLHSSLKILIEQAENPDSILAEAGETRIRMVTEMVLGIRETLKKLEAVAVKYGLLEDTLKGRKIWLKL